MHGPCIEHDLKVHLPIVDEKLFSHSEMAVTASPDDSKAILSCHYETGMYLHTVIYNRLNSNINIAGSI